MRGERDAPLPAAPHILVVDDDPAIGGLIAEVLQDEGSSVVTSSNGLEAPGHIAARRPWLLLDLMMPVMTGWDMLATLREQGLAIPIEVVPPG